MFHGFLNLPPQFIPHTSTHSHPQISDRQRRPSLVFLPAEEMDVHQIDRSDVSSVKLQMLIEENVKLTDTQWDIKADLDRIETDKDELSQLLQRACSLLRPPSTPNTQYNPLSVTSHPAEHVEDDDWPEPPPAFTDDMPECHSSMLIQPLPAIRSALMHTSVGAGHSSQYEDQIRYS